VQPYRESRTPIAIGILVSVVLLAAFNIIPIVVSAVAGCVAMVLTGCLSTEEAYQAINWKIIFLLAGVIPLGTAMENTGAAGILSSTLIDVLGPIGPTAVLSGFFFLSMMLTNIISNQATAALLAPIALQAAATLGIDSRPLLMAITFAASLSFMTPVGYQTNTMIYGPGQYKFTDFTKVGTPLNLILWVMATFLIPWIWPF
jgi:di/tricarboxylate transporter